MVTADLSIELFEPGEVADILSDEKITTAQITVPGQDAHSR